MKTETDPSSPSAQPATRRRTWRRILLIAGPVIVLAGGLFLYLRGGRFVSTDNAYIRADKVPISAEVSGKVVEVAVEDNQRVAAGQVLFRLDDEAARIALASAQAQLDAVKLELTTLRATYREKMAAIDEAREQLAFARREQGRQEELASSHVGTEAELDRARHTTEAAERHLAVLQQEAATAEASLGGNVAAPLENDPRLQQAQASVDDAGRQLLLTVVKAPQAGIVTNVTNVQVGKYLSATTPAFTLVATKHVWVEANMKETDLTHVKIGDPVRVEVDTYPGREFRGRVSAISPATGAEFALIPPQNASGNWVKVVQRIPVDVTIDDDGETPLLRAGMSATVEIDTGHARSLRTLAGLAVDPYES